VLLEIGNQASNEEQQSERNESQVISLGNFCMLGSPPGPKKRTSHVAWTNELNCHAFSFVTSLSPIWRAESKHCLNALSERIVEVLMTLAARRIPTAKICASTDSRIEQNCLAVWRYDE
jgi:hypothetical protein